MSASILAPHPAKNSSINTRAWLQDGTAVIQMTQQKSLLPLIFGKMRNAYDMACARAMYLFRLPVIRQLRCIQLRRLHPLENGHQRGTPIVRYYWAQFLKQHQADIQGVALEIGTTSTIQQYGKNALTRADALDVTAHNSEVNVVADLTRADNLIDNTYDCFVNQFTMHLLYDLDAAFYHSIRILKSDGVLLVNFPCVDYYFADGLDMGTGSPLFMHWWFTPLQVENLLRRVGLSKADYQIESYGNVFARIAYQMNMPAEELTRQELNYIDPGHPLLICVRVVKPENWQVQKPQYRDPWLPEVIPAKWNSKVGHYAKKD